MKTEKIIILARKHLNNDSSRLALKDAVNLFDSGDLLNAKRRALKSLIYSIGAFHKDYKRASK